MCVLALLLWLMASIAPAHAAGLDCKKAASATERAICADPALSQLDDALARAYADAMANVPQPIGLRDLQRDWIVRMRDKATVAALPATLQNRIGELRQAANAARATRKPVAPDLLATRCVDLRHDQDETCTVDSSGGIADSPGGKLAWQLQSYHQDKLRTAGGVVLLSVQPDGHLLPVLWDEAEDAEYGEPTLVATPAGKLIDFNGSLSGTGNLSAESLYRFADGAWHEIDITSWLHAMSMRLPKGLAAWKGVYPDWAHMTAATNLWRPGDANCCPTGGSVRMSLALKDGQIVMTGMQVSRTLLP